MPSKALFVVLPLVASLLLAREAGPDSVQETPAPTFTGEVEQVTVDVVVTDGEGTPIRGLTEKDLEIFEDGVRQEVVSFEAVHVPPAPAATPRPRPRIATNQNPEDGRGRTFVVFFDDNHLTLETAYRAKGAVADFLTRGVREGDRVTLVASSGAAWWSARMEAGREELIEIVKRLDGLRGVDDSRERLTDYEAMRIYLRRDTEVAFRVQRRFEEFGVVMPLGEEPAQARHWATSISPYLEQRAAVVYRRSHPRNRMTLDALERALEALDATRGRKSLILISEGFIYDPDLERDFRQVVRATRRANTAIYFVNARGLEGMPSLMTAQFGPTVPQRDLSFVFSEDFEVTQGADALASESGGFVINNTNDLSGGFERIAHENSSYYLVGYNPTNPDRDGRFREISVKVPGRKGVKVRARKGYYAPSDEELPDDQPGVDAVFQEALDAPHDVGDIPLRMTHLVRDEVRHGAAQVSVITEVDLNALDLEAREGRYVGGLEFLLVVAHRDAGEYSRYDQKLEMKLLPDSRERMQKTGFPILREFELAPGGYKAKIVVRDMRSGRLGTVAHEFSVPELAGFRVSTPVLTDTRREEEAPPGRQALPVARRGFAQGEELFCEVEVYGARKDDSGLPQVVMGYAVRRTDGSLLARVEPSLILPTSVGHLSRLFRLELPGAQPGDYELVLAFGDMLSGEFLELREPFTLLPESAPRQASTTTGR